MAVIDPPKVPAQYKAAIIAIAATGSKRNCKKESEVQLPLANLGQVELQLKTPIKTPDKIKNYINCDYLITNTDDIRKFVISQGWDPNMVKRINNFVKKENNYKNKIVESINNKKYRIILALGRFHENKAFEILIEALLKLENHFLWLLGRGELKADYIKLAKSDWG